MLALMPPGNSVKASCTSFSPCNPRKASEKTCAQIRMNITMAVMRVVDFLQAELAVEIGPDEFGGVDHAAFERREDVAGRQQLRVDAELAVDAAGQAGNAHLEALEILDLLDRLAEPAGHLHAGIAGEERHQIELVVDLAPQFEAAAVIDPAVEARRN